MSNDPTVPQPRRDPYRLTGEVFDGRYRIDSFVSSGSFGAVYRAVNIRVGKVVAVKVLKPDLKEDLADTARELFQREALTVGNLNHPHIVNIIDVGEEFGFAYMVMEWLEGDTLESEIKRRKVFTGEDTAKILSDITDALHTAHEQGIVHRDIKPSNIHLGRAEKNVVKVLDFGIAKIMSTASRATASRIAGTLEYASPEQISGGMIDRRSDIYSLGVMTYQMLTGELPFKANSEAHLIQMHLMEQPPKLSERRKDLPEATSAVIEKAMAKSSEDRFQSAVEFRRAFVDSLSGHKAVSFSDMETLLAVTKASPIETETKSPQGTENKQPRAHFLNLPDNLQTTELNPAGTKERSLAETVQENLIETPPAPKIKEKHYTLHYAIGGALFMFIVRYLFWQEIHFRKDIKMETFFAVDIPIGLFIGLILSEMRTSAWWSVRKGRRITSACVHALTGAAILYVGAWAFFYLNFFYVKVKFPVTEDFAQLYISESHLFINQGIPLLIPVGLLIGLVVWGIRGLLYNEADSAPLEIKPFVDESKSKLNIYLVIGCALISLIVSFILYLVTTYYTEASFFRVVQHTIMGASLGLIIGQLLKPSGTRWSVTDGFYGRSLLLHGFTGYFVLSFAVTLQYLVYVFIATFGEVPPIKTFLMAYYGFSPLPPLFIFRSAIIYFIIGFIVCFARLLAHKSKRPGLIYTLCGLLCSFILCWNEYFPEETWIPYCLLNVLIGTMFFASLSELRRGALWSVAKGRRVKAFLVHAATGITVITGIEWLPWYFFILTKTRLAFRSESVYIILALLSLAGFILGLIVCGVRVGLNEALSKQE